MNKKLIIYSIICGFGTLVFLSFRTTSIVQEPWKAPSWADTLRNPYQLRGENAWGARMVLPSVLLEGEKLYNTSCVSCHGKNGLGDGAPGITFIIKPASFHDKSVTDQKDGALFWKISEGRGLMPAFGTILSDEKRWQLVAYIRQLSTQNTVVTSKLENSLPKAGFTIDPKMTSQYFPVPLKVLNVVKSESQLFMEDTVVSGLTRPWSMAFLPDKSVLIAERSKLLRVKNGKVQGTPIGGDVPKELRDIVLHPQYEKNGWIYISYYIDPVKPNGGYTVLMRARLVGDKLVDSKILYKAGPFQEDGFWYGSKIAFDNKGYLYFVVGQRTMDERHRWKTVQDLSSPSGKIMRLKDDGSIPADNPFLKTAGALPEIYTLGHRQPEGLIRDPLTGRIWETEHGEMGGGELNLIGPGLNYGWPDVTFSLNYDGTIISKDTIRDGMVSPVRYWTPEIAPGALDFVHGDRYPGWEGSVFVGSLVQRMLVRDAIKNNRFIHEEKLLQNIGRVRDVVYGPDKFLYVMTEDTGLIVRLIPVRKSSVSVKK